MTGGRDAAAEFGLRRTDPDVQRLMDTARGLQLVTCLVLVPQLPMLADGLAGLLEPWRESPTYRAPGPASP